MFPNLHYYNSLHLHSLPCYIRALQIVFQKPLVVLQCLPCKNQITWHGVESSPLAQISSYLYHPLLPRPRVNKIIPATGVLCLCVSLNVAQAVFFITSVSEYSFSYTAKLHINSTTQPFLMSLKRTHASLFLASIAHHTHFVLVLMIFVTCFIPVCLCVIYEFHSSSMINEPFGVRR